MRYIILFTLLSMLGARAEQSRLEALSMIESGDNDAAVGAAGEVSRYQIQPWIWRQYSRSQAYQNVQVSTRVAQQHLATLEQMFRKCARREATDFDLYVLWNAGPTYYANVRWTASRVHPVVQDRARRYANLRQWALQKKSNATAPQTASVPVTGVRLLSAGQGRPTTRPGLIPFGLFSGLDCLVVAHNSVCTATNAR